MALLMKPDNTAITVSPRNGNNFELDELQEYVGGYIEICYPGIFNSHHADKIMVINEEGKLQGLPLNQLATLVYGNPDDVIVGNALFCFSREVE